MNKNRGKKKKRNKNFLIRIIKVLLCFNSEGGVCGGGKCFLRNYTCVHKCQT